MSGRRRAAVAVPRVRPFEGRRLEGGGLRAEFSSAGGLRRFEAGPLSLLLFPASEHEDGLVRLFLRRREGSLVGRPLFGVTTRGEIAWLAGGPLVTSDVDGVSAIVRFRLSDRQRAWFWHVRLTNTSARPVEVDLVYTHDLALAPYGIARMNEAYVSQYLDLTPVEIPDHGPAIAVRQNMPGSRHPWALIGCLTRSAAWATDALQLAGRGHFEGEPLPGLAADLPSTRLQHEHSLVALQSESIRLVPGESATTGFYGILIEEHPEATSDADVDHALRVLADPAAVAPADCQPDPSMTVPIVGSLLGLAPVVHCSAASLEPPQDARHVEGEGGLPLAWFLPDGTHVVTAAKERAVLRPHGTILRSGGSLVPAERAVTATAWLAGTFLSHLAQGHVSRGAVISIRRTYLGLQPAHGLRIFVADPASPDAWSLLGVPAAWEVRLDGCRWRYVTSELDLVVTLTVPSDADEARLEVHAARPVRLLVAAHLALGGDDGATLESPPLRRDRAGVTVGTGERILRLEWPAGSVEAVADDAPLRTDRRSTGSPWLTLLVAPTTEWRLVVRPQLEPVEELGLSVRPDDDDPWAMVRESPRLRPARTGPDVVEVERIDTILPWFAHDALVHYLSPHGLEQFTGGGWGTRDVCQGPMGLLIALGEHEAIRDLIRRVFSAQNARGDWPQWFEFYARHAIYEQRDSHGDVIYWPLLALGEYLAASGDRSILKEVLPFVGDGGPTAPASVLEHVSRALDAIEASRIPGTHLPAYGHGDWNDSLQPADPALAAGLVSTWTVVLESHALRTLADALAMLDEPSGDVAARARWIAAEGAAAMLDLLLVDGVLAGYGLFDPAGHRPSPQRPRELLVHPSDRRTGLRYSLLPMIHAISAGLLPPNLARAQLRLITTHLTGPDGARLFDRPVGYAGGPMAVFQRAEAATFFGREIGLMYVHAHLRYAEALARLGEADAFFRALALANPIGITERVRSARPRQSTTYFSSSDAWFADRYAAADGYRGVLEGAVPLEGGWRVYSSGPGIFLRLVVENLLGIRQRGRRLEIDPVLPPALDGLTATVRLGGRPLRLRYRVGSRGCGVRRVGLDGVPLAGEPLVEPYRPAGVAVSRDDVIAALRTSPMTLEIEVD